MINSLLGLISIINISTILTLDKIGKPLREYVGITHMNGWPDKETKLKGMKGFVGDILWCFKCTSVWVSFFVTFLWWFNESLYKWFTIAFSFSWFVWFFNPLLEKLAQKFK